MYDLTLFSEFRNIDLENILIEKIKASDFVKLYPPNQYWYGFTSVPEGYTMLNCRNALLKAKEPTVTEWLMYVNTVEYDVAMATCSTRAWRGAVEILMRTLQHAFGYPKPPGKKATTVVAWEDDVDGLKERARFPSMPAAAGVLGVGWGELSKCVRTGYRCAGCLWSKDGDFPKNEAARHDTKRGDAPWMFGIKSWI